MSCICHGAEVTCLRDHLEEEPCVLEPCPRCSPHESAASRVKAFLEARAAMGDNIDHEKILTVGVFGEVYDLTTDDLRILSGWDGKPLERDS